MMLPAVLLITAILANFVCMARAVFSPHVGMTLTAFMALIILGSVHPEETINAVQAGAGGFARVAVLFTAIAAPSHMLARSEVLDKLGLWVGESVGWFSARGQDGGAFTRRLLDPILLISIFSIFSTWALAALLHNTTAILVAAGVVSALCRYYDVPAVPVLSGTLVASNLGGFSTRWGDTPNIIEAHTWDLDARVFATQILPINVVLLVFLTVTVYALTVLRVRSMPGRERTSLRLSHAMSQFRSRKRNVEINRRLAITGGSGLLVAIAATTVLSRYEIPVSAIAILICVAFDYSDSRKSSLFALGGETYATLIAIFVVADVVANPAIGISSLLGDMLHQHGGNLALITGVSYVGTLLTEAGSWATAAAPIVHSADTSVGAAWALGGGICAGSSSLITAATAGVILLRETRANPEGQRVTFGNYAIFGLAFSVFMVIYYSVALALLGF